MSDDQASILAKTARGTGWVVAWRMATRVLGLCSTLVLVRLLAPADFGLVALATSFATSIEAFSWIGVEEGVIRHPNPTRGVLDTAFTLSALRGVAIGLVIAACAAPGAAFFNEPRLAPVVLALALSSFLETLQNIGTVEFRREFSFQKEFRLFLLPRLVSIAAAIGMAALFHSYWALITAILVGRVARLLLSYTMHPYRPRLSLTAWRDLMGYSVWNVVIAAAGVARDRSDNIVVGRLMGATSVGYYAVGYEIAELPTSELIAPLTRAAFSGFATAQRSAVDAGQTWLRLVSAMALVTLPAGVGISAVAQPLLGLAFGPAWGEAVPVVQMMGVALCLTVFGMVGQTVFLAHGRMAATLVLTVIGLVVRVAGLVVLVPRFGLAGAAAAAALGVGIEQLLSAGMVMRALSLSPVRDLLPLVWRCLLATVAMAAVLYGTGLGWNPAQAVKVPARLLELGGIATLGAVTYGTVLAAAWLLTGRRTGPEADMAQLVRRAAGR